MSALFDAAGLRFSRNGLWNADEAGALTLDSSAFCSVRHRDLPITTRNTCPIRKKIARAAAGAAVGLGQTWSGPENARRDPCSSDRHQRRSHQHRRWCALGNERASVFGPFTCAGPIARPNRRRRSKRERYPTLGRRLHSHDAGNSRSGPLQVGTTFLQLAWRLTRRDSGRGVGMNG